MHGPNKSDNVRQRECGAVCQQSKACACLELKRRYAYGPFALRPCYGHGPLFQRALRARKKKGTIIHGRILLYKPEPFARGDQRWLKSHLLFSIAASQPRAQRASPCPFEKFIENLPVRMLV